MTVVVMRLNDSLIIMVQPNNARQIGNLTFEVKPGESALGRTYDEWLALGEGEHELE